MRAQTEANMSESSVNQLHLLLSKRGDHRATSELLKALIPEYIPEEKAAMDSIHAKV